MKYLTVFYHNMLILVISLPIISWRKGELGLLKSETADIPIREAVALQAKCYSVLLDDGNTNNTAKGVNISEKNILTHDLYSKMHDRKLKTSYATCMNIRKVKNRIYTVETRKRAMGKIDRKRYWVDSCKSYAYGNLKIVKRVVNDLKKRNNFASKIGNFSKYNKHLDLNFKSALKPNPFSFYHRNTLSETECLRWVHSTFWKSDYTLENVPIQKDTVIV